MLHLLLLLLLLRVRENQITIMMVHLVMIFFEHRLPIRKGVRTLTRSTVRTVLSPTAAPSDHLKLLMVDVWYPHHAVAPHIAAIRCAYWCLLLQRLM